jgi:hypothetical protein
MNSRESRRHDGCFAPFDMSWEQRLRGMILAGSALAATACDGSTAAQSSTVPGGCCNGSPDPCCFLGCPSATAASQDCEESFAQCEAMNGFYGWQPDGSLGCTLNRSCLPALAYDQLCTQDSDCVGIAEGQLCEDGCTDCVNAAINVRDQAMYKRAVSGYSGTCSCPGVPIACNAGTCGLATFPSAAPEAGSQDAAADAGASDASDAASE